MPIKIFLLLLTFLVSCARPVPPVQKEPEKVSLEPMAQHAQTPTAAASTRLVELGRKELNQSHFERAAAHFSKAIEIDAANAFAYFYLGLTRMQTAKYPQATGLFRRASDLFSTSAQWRAESLAYAGECFEKNRQWFEAQQSYMRALEIDGNNQRAKEGAERVEK
jgi:tetratricopeptide (TPR) repeat protein